MKNKIIICLILCISFFNETFSQIYYNNQQGLKRSSLLKIEKNKVEYEKDTFVLGGVALHPSQTSVFAMAGIVKKYGLYLKLKTNLNFNSSYAGEGDAYYAASSRYFDGNTYSGRLALTGGALLRISKPFILYGGLGYGNRWVNWETISGDRYRITDISYNGLEAEANIGVGYKLNLKNKTIKK